VLSITQGFLQVGYSFRSALVLVPVNANFAFQYWSEFLLLSGDSMVYLAGVDVLGWIPSEVSIHTVPEKKTEQCADL